MSIDQFAEKEYDCLDREQDCPMEPEPGPTRDQQCEQDIKLLQSILSEMEGRYGWDDTRQAFDRIIDCLAHNGYE